MSVALFIFDDMNRANEIEWASLKPRSAEWKAAWQAMVQEMGDEDFEAFDDESGEVWQYIASYRRDKVWAHEFRHRNHPRTSARIVLSVRATKGWEPTPSALVR